MANQKPTKVSIIKHENDPITTRISLGGESGGDVYLVYRGDREKVLAVLEVAFKVFSAYMHGPEDPITPSDAIGVGNKPKFKSN